MIATKTAARPIKPGNPTSSAKPVVGKEVARGVAEPTAANWVCRLPMVAVNWGEVRVPPVIAPPMGVVGLACANTLVGSLVATGGTAVAGAWVDVEVA